MNLNTSQQDLDINLGAVFHILSRMIAEIFQRTSLQQSSSHKLTQPQLHMLMLLNAAGRHKISELTRLHNISPPAVTKNIDKLESLGLVRRLLHDGDRRLVRVEITPGGSEITQQYRAIYMEKVKRGLSGFSVQEKKGLMQLLEDFIRNGIASHPDSELICLECQGRFSDSCVLQDHFDRCLFERAE